ncbi:NADPH-dependent 2,4-dienoyl-CoA reductase/sulfur reductase-like enzyme [Paraburkholderia sp. GAS38]|uniref:FAD-dependent oxidoreductase n=1 Tax=Paraburkholderia sp. GAS38 TaxID=3035133 RepID=UPI003D21D213
MNRHYDVVVVGAGPAGLNAARTAAQAGAEVAVFDDNPRVGGQVWRQGPGHAPQAPLREVHEALTGHPNVTVFSSVRVIAPLPPHALLLESAAEQGGMCVSYGQLILATGARERLLPFAGWTLPGVTGAGALQALIKGGTPVRGERVVIAGSGPLLLASLATARAAGAQVVAVVEQASALALAHFAASLLATPSKLLQAAQLTRGFAGLRYLSGSVVREARGAGRVEQVTIQRGEREITLDCDRIACGYGLVPNITLAQALGCALDVRGAVRIDDLQRTSVPGVLAAGECTGIGGMELARVEGEIAGYVASGALPDLGARPDLRAQRSRWQRFAQRVDDAFTLSEAARALPPDDTLLCRCEDVTLGEVRTHAEWRDAKLHTRCGMGACQGRICGTAAGTYFGWQTAQPRPPFHPAQIGTLMAACEQDLASTD